MTGVMPDPAARYAHEPGSPPSAEVTPDARLRLPHGITGKLLTGERLHVGVLRFAPGAKFANYRRDNEQFVFVVQGELEVELVVRLVAYF